MKTNQISDCENQSEKTLEQRKSQAETKYMKEWKNHLTSRIEKVWCPIHQTYEKTEFMQMGFGQKVLARKCVTYWYEGINEPKHPHENFFDLVPIEDGF